MKKVLILSALVIIAAAAVIIAEFAAVNGATREKQAITAVAKETGRKPAVTLIIDAGHGGADGGAVSDSGLLRESELNLDIAQKLDLLAGFFGVKTVMTRNSETIEYSSTAKTIREKKAEDTKKRLATINGIQNAVLISIHQNKYPSPGPFGAQVLYAKTPHSKEFAEELQKQLISALNPDNYRAAARIQDSIYIMNNVKCPAVLIECGFLSNPGEDALLQTDGYRTKIAASIAAGFLSNQNTFESNL